MNYKNLTILAMLGLLTGAALADDIADLKLLITQTQIEIAAIDPELNTLKGNETIAKLNTENVKTWNTQNAAKLTNFAPRGQALLEKSKFLARVGSNLVVSGGNLQIRHSANQDAAANGLGNLIIGYNELGAITTRTGSNNLIIGSGHSWKGSNNLISGNTHQVDTNFNALLTGYKNRAQMDDMNVILTGSENGAQGKYGFLATGFGSWVSERSLTLSGTHAVSLSSGSVVVTGEETVAAGSQSFIGTGWRSRVSRLGSGLGIGWDGHNYTDWYWKDHPD